MHTCLMCSNINDNVMLIVFYLQCNVYLFPTFISYIYMYIIRMKIERNEYGYRDSVSIRIEYKIFPLEGYKFNARYYDAMRN